MVQILHSEQVWNRQELWLDSSCHQAASISCGTDVSATVTRSFPRPLYENEWLQPLASCRGSQYAQGSVFSCSSRHAFIAATKSMNTVGRCWINNGLFKGHCLSLLALVLWADSFEMPLKTSRKLLYIKPPDLPQASLPVHGSARGILRENMHLVLYPLCLNVHLGWPQRHCLLECCTYKQYLFSSSAGHLTQLISVTCVCWETIDEWQKHNIIFLSFWNLTGTVTQFNAYIDSLSSLKLKAVAHLSKVTFGSLVLFG